MYVKTIYFLFVFQLLDMEPQDSGEEDGANIDLDAQRKGKCAVIKTSTRQVLSLLIIKTNVCLFKKKSSESLISMILFFQIYIAYFQIVEKSFFSMSFFFFQTYFLPVIGLVDPEKLSPGDIVVRHRYLFLENIEVLILLHFILKTGYVVLCQIPQSSILFYFISGC